MKHAQRGLALQVFVPHKGKKASDEDEAEKDEEEEEDSEPKGADALLGNAFDAFEDGDRAGFVRSMRAALRTLEG